MDLSRFEKIEDQTVEFPKIEETASSKITYFDENGKATDKQHATSAIIREFDKDGNLVNETFGFCTPETEKSEPKQR